MKQRLLTLLLTLFCISITAEAQNDLTSSTLGDANGDGIVDVADIVEVLNYLMDKQSIHFNKERADANRDGNISIEDVEKIKELIISPQKEFKHTLYIHLTNGITETIMLNTFPSISFSGDNMIIKSKESERKYLRINVQKFTYQ